MAVVRLSKAVGRMNGGGRFGGPVGVKGYFGVLIADYHGCQRE